MTNLLHGNESLHSGQKEKSAICDRAEYSTYAEQKYAELIILNVSSTNLKKISLHNILIVKGFTKVWFFANI
jgi:hypothetical protein